MISFLLILIISNQQLVFGFQFRSAKDEDISAARKILFQQAMNPLSLSKENLIVAFDDELNDEPLVGFGQIRPLGSEFSELASLFVVPGRRNQGVGGAIVEELLKRHEQASSSKQVCLLTLKPTTSFYERYGFQLASESERKKLPATLQLELQAGNALSIFLGNDLVCMIRKRKQ